MKLLKGIFVVLTLVLLLYMVWPTGPQDISDFSELPNSTTSDLPGDTWQTPNIAAYFSENYRGFVIPYYINDYKSFTNFPIDPLRLNYPPEYAFSAIKDQTHATYLEEITYPLRDSVFISGLEPFDEETKEPRYDGAHMLPFDGEKYETKTILRFYPSPLWARVGVWLGITLSFAMLWVMTKKIIFEK